MTDIIKIVKSLEEPGLLIKEAKKKQKGGFLRTILGLLGASSLVYKELGNLLPHNAKERQHHVEDVSNHSWSWSYLSWQKLEQDGIFNVT